MVEAPQGGQNPSSDTLQRSLHDLEMRLKDHAQDVAAFVVEPLLQGAGGFNMYSPEYLNQARRLCDEYNVLLIFDNF